MKCENCGAPINKDTKICPYCKQYNTHYEEKITEHILMEKENKEEIKPKDKTWQSAIRYGAMLVIFLSFFFIVNAIGGNRVFSTSKIFLIVFVIVIAVINQFVKDKKK